MAIIDNLINEHSQSLQHIQKDIPQAVDALKDLADFAVQSSILDAKTKALLTLTLAVHHQSLDCIVYHAKNALVQLVTIEEIRELVMIFAYMGGGPGMMAAEQAVSIFEKLSAEENEKQESSS